MDNRDDRNKISNEVEQCCDNKEKLKVDEQIKLQNKFTKQVKRKYSASGSTDEDARKFRRKSASHEKQEGGFTVRCI
jgi:hypothetical protein